MPTLGCKIEAGLMASSELSKDLMHPGQDIRPCVAQMLDNSYSKGDFPGRNTVALIIASELRRLGRSQEDVLSRVEKWNEGNSLPLRYSEYSKAVRNAFGKEYNYGCDNPCLELTCMGKESCPFGRMVRSKRKTYNNRVFFRYRWPEILSNVAKSIYFLALIELERIRQVGAGGLIFASHRDIARLAGVSRRYAKKGLEELEAAGLVQYQPGTPRRWEGKASEIKRIIPIPKPSATLLRKLRGDK